MKQLNLEEARKATGHPAHLVAEAIGKLAGASLSRSQLYRIERGECQPSRKIARAMRTFYGSERRLPDLAIYDPEAFEARRARG